MNCLLVYLQDHPNAKLEAIQRNSGPLYHVLSDDRGPLIASLDLEELRQMAKDLYQRELVLDYGGTHKGHAMDTVFHRMRELQLSAA